MKVIYENITPWVDTKYQHTSIYFAGYFIHNNIFFEKTEAAEIIRKKISENKSNSIKDMESLIKWISSSLKGHFGFIYIDSNFVIGFSDKVRSFPIFYHLSERTIGNYAPLIKKKLVLREFDEDSILEFKMSGYVLDKKTLVKGLLQILPGEAVIYNRKREKFTFVRYFQYISKPFINTKEELLKKLNETVINTFNDFFVSIKNKPVYIPLSGGLDSRLIVSLLKEYGHDKIYTYTYGLKGIWDIKNAKFIAKKLGINWVFLNFIPKDLKRLYHSLDREEYYKFSGGLCSTPNLSDYYSLIYLKKKINIPEDAIFVNGQTGDFITGGHIPKTVYSSLLNDELLLQSIIDKHLSLWENYKTNINLDKINSTLKTYFVQKKSEEKLTQNNFSTFFEYFEWQERQSKFVVNGQRMYEWHDYDWRLPLWSDQFFEFWKTVDIEYKFGQNLFKEYLLKKNFAGVFNLNLPKRYNYAPYYAKFLRRTFDFVELLTNKNYDKYSHKYTRFFMHYAPFYPQIKYTEYLQDSYFHRNVVSYWSRIYLAEVLREN